MHQVGGGALACGGEAGGVSVAVRQGTGAGEAGEGAGDVGGWHGWGEGVAGAKGCGEWADALC